MVPGMMPRTPPPSMLSTVTMLPKDGGGDLGVVADVDARLLSARCTGSRVRDPLPLLTSGTCTVDMAPYVPAEDLSVSVRRCAPLISRLSLCAYVAMLLCDVLGCGWL
jgi:hypothetical protein